MKKSPAVAYYSYKIRITSKENLYESLENSPLRPKEYAFVADIIEGLTNDELAKKYNKSYSRIAAWKREMCEILLAYENNSKKWQTHNRNSNCISEMAIA